MPQHADEVIDFLKKIGHGEMLECIAEDLRQMEQAINGTGKAAELTIKIKIEPNGGAKRVVTFEDKVKLPRTPASNTYLFATAAGQYVENDPDERQLPLENVTAIDDSKRKILPAPETRREFATVG